MLDYLLGDPFLQNIFGTSVPKNVTVTSPAAAIKVLALPTQGRPPDFGGAVGTFKISADISSSKNTAGGPPRPSLPPEGGRPFGSGADPPRRARRPGESEGTEAHFQPR